MPLVDAFYEFESWIYQVMDFINNNKILMLMLIGSLLGGCAKLVSWFNDIQD